jgi:hypothetical protein
MQKRARGREMRADCCRRSFLFRLTISSRRGKKISVVLLAQATQRPVHGPGCQIAWGLDDVLDKLPRVCDWSPIDRTLGRINAEPAIEGRGGRELQVEVEELVEATRCSQEYGWLELSRMMLEQRSDARHQAEGPRICAAAEDQGINGAELNRT